MEDLDIGPKVSIRNLVKDFEVGRSRSKSVVRAIDDVTIDIAKGEFVCIVGASGCGKSTLLNIVSGLESLTHGVVEIDGEPAYSLYPWKTVAENVAFGLEIAHMARAERDERVTELLGIMELTDFADRLPKELSGGMRQRVAIARALAPSPDVLLLDEPFGALDALTKRSLQTFLRLVWLRTGTTILMVTHDVPEAVFLSQRICVMTPHPGRLAEIVDVPFGDVRGPTTKRDPRFLDLVDEIEDMLHADHSEGVQ
ncbi:UNVERIFIED_CONTAM: hypothetical protein GTU68_045298 [Idotea baltica]|nr:hypothetical protein [Idotea baltica]